MEDIILKRQQSLTKRMQDNCVDNLLISKMENILYYSGFKGSFGYLFVSGGTFYLIVDGRYTTQAENTAKGCKIIGYRYPVQDVLNEISNIEELYIESYHLTTDAFIDLDDEYERVFSCGELVECSRECKDEKEIENIRRAVEIADNAFTHILGYIKPGIKEKDIALELEYNMKKQGAEGLAFDTIVASGYRSALPHGMASDKVIEYGDVITMDYGARYNNYCSDMTRTVFVGQADDKLKEMYDIVLKAQLAVAEATKAGMELCEVDNIARKVITDSGYGKYFTHSLGHGIGIEEHESPTVSPRAEGKLKAGSVISNEPGIYIKNIGGIRIEDLMLVGDNGVETLTKSDKGIIVL